MNRYRLTSRLETSELAELCTAIRESSGAAVLIKLFQPKTSDPRCAEILGNTSRQLAGIRDDGLIPYTDVGMVRGRLALVREYVDGVTLGEALTKLNTREMVLPSAVGLAIVIQLLDAVQRAHDAGVVHGAITPGNVVLSRAGRAGLTDFGALRALQSVPALKSFTAKGRDSYRSMEVANGELGTELSDVYSLGALAYELLTLKEPSSKGSGMSTRREALPGPSRVDRRLNGRIDPIVMRALEATPTRRFRSCSEFAAAIRNFLSTTGGMALREDVQRFMTDLMARDVRPAPGPVPFSEPFELAGLLEGARPTAEAPVTNPGSTRPAFSGGELTAGARRPPAPPPEPRMAIPPSLVDRTGEGAPPYVEPPPRPTLPPPPASLAASAAAATNPFDSEPTAASPRRPVPIGGGQGPRPPAPIAGGQPPGRAPIAGALPVAGGQPPGRAPVPAAPPFAGPQQPVGSGGQPPGRLPVPVAPPVAGAPQPLVAGQSPGRAPIPGAPPFAGAPQSVGGGQPPGRAPIPGAPPFAGAQQPVGGSGARSTLPGGPVPGASGERPTVPGQRPPVDDAGNPFGEEPTAASAPRMTAMGLERAPMQRGPVQNPFAEDERTASVDAALLDTLPFSDLEQTGQIIPPAPQGPQTVFAEDQSASDGPPVPDSLAFTEDERTGNIARRALANAAPFGDDDRTGVVERKPAAPGSVFGGDRPSGAVPEAAVSTALPVRRTAAAPEPFTDGERTGVVQRNLQPPAPPPAPTSSFASPVSIAVPVRRPTSTGMPVMDAPPPPPPSARRPGTLPTQDAVPAADPTALSGAGRRPLGEAGTPSTDPAAPPPGAIAGQPPKRVGGGITPLAEPISTARPVPQAPTLGREPGSGKGPAAGQPPAPPVGAGLSPRRPGFAPTLAALPTTNLPPTDGSLAPKWPISGAVPTASTPFEDDRTGVVQRQVPPTASPFAELGTTDLYGGRHPASASPVGGVPAVDPSRRPGDAKPFADEDRTGMVERHAVPASVFGENPSVSQAGSARRPGGAPFAEPFAGEDRTGIVERRVPGHASAFADAPDTGLPPTDPGLPSRRLGAPAEPFESNLPPTTPGIAARRPGAGFPDAPDSGLPPTSPGIPSKRLGAAAAEPFADEDRTGVVQRKVPGQSSTFSAVPDSAPPPTGPITGSKRVVLPEPPDSGLPPTSPGIPSKRPGAAPTEPFADEDRTGVVQRKVPGQSSAFSAVPDSAPPPTGPTTGSKRVVPPEPPDSGLPPTSPGIPSKRPGAAPEPFADEDRTGVVQRKVPGQSSAFSAVPDSAPPPTGPTTGSKRVVLPEPPDSGLPSTAPGIPSKRAAAASPFTDDERTANVQGRAPASAPPPRRAPGALSPPGGVPTADPFADQDSTGIIARRPQASAPVFSSEQTPPEGASTSDLDADGEMEATADLAWSSLVPGRDASQELSIHDVSTGLIPQRIPPRLRDEPSEEPAAAEFSGPMPLAEDEHTGLIRRPAPEPARNNPFIAEEPTARRVDAIAAPQEPEPAPEPMEEEAEPAYEEAYEPEPAYDAEPSYDPQPPYSAQPAYDAEDAEPEPAGEPEPEEAFEADPADIDPSAPEPASHITGGDWEAPPGAAPQRPGRRMPPPEEVVLTNAGKSGVRSRIKVYEDFSPPSSPNVPVTELPPELTGMRKRPGELTAGGVPIPIATPPETPEQAAALPRDTGEMEAQGGRSESSDSLNGTQEIRRDTAEVAALAVAVARAERRKIGLVFAILIALVGIGAFAYALRSQQKLPPGPVPGEGAYEPADHTDHPPRIDPTARSMDEAVQKYETDKGAPSSPTPAAGPVTVRPSSEKGRDEDTKLHVPAPKRGAAFLTAISNVPAYVYIDGARVKKRTPLRAYPITPGEHAIAIEEIETHKRRAQTLHFDKGQSRRVEERFETP